MNVFVMIVLIVFIVMIAIPVMTVVESKGKIKLEEMKAVNARIEGLNNHGCEDLIQEIKAENASLKAELSEIKAVVSSIEKMMKEIE